MASPHELADARRAFYDSVRGVYYETRGNDSTALTFSGTGALPLVVPSYALTMKFLKPLCEDERADISRGLHQLLDRHVVRPLSPLNRDQDDMAFNPMKDAHPELVVHLPASKRSSGMLIVRSLEKCYYEDHPSPYASSVLNEFLGRTRPNGPQPRPDAG